MPKNSFLQALFSGPKFSLAPIEQNFRGNVKIGEVIPVYARVVNPREGVEINMSHLVRFMPAKAPVMEGYKVTFDAFAVPYSALGYAERKERDIDDFFNMELNDGTISNPFCFPFSSLGSMFFKGRVPNSEDASNNSRTSLAHAFEKGSLGDYLNFPSLKNIRDYVRQWLDLNPLAHGSRIFDYVRVGSGDPSSICRSAAEFVTLAYLNHEGVEDSSSDTIDFTGSGNGTFSCVFGVPFIVSELPLLLKGTLGGYVEHDNVFATYVEDENVFGFVSFVGAYSLLGYVLRNYPLVASYYGADLINPTNFANHLRVMMENNPDSFSLDYLSKLYEFYQIDAQSIYDEYFEFIMAKVLYNSSLRDLRDGDTLYSENWQWLPWLPDTKPVDLTLFATYWKIISDWYINTNIDGDPDDFFLRHCRLFTFGMNYEPDHWVDVKPFSRRWSNDIFTSAVPMSRVQNVRIPVDGTIPDLRDANAFQKLKDILRNTGSRLRDVIFGVRGARASAVRSEMSEPIASKSTWVGFQSVLQTSQTTKDSPQAAYSGIGTDSTGFNRFFKYVNNAEPTPVVVMVLMSVTQRSQYMQGFDRNFFHSSIYDFAIPQLAMVGEQEINNHELYFDKEYEPGIFGFNRRYYEWFDSRSSVHGDFRDNMDYWHGARVFDSQPALNSEFIGIDSDADHLQRIFANISESARPIAFNISFDGYATVSLPRYIQYEL